MSKDRRPEPPPDAFRARAESLRTWRQAFLSASTLQERLKLLFEFGLDDRDIVRALGSSGVTERSVRRWRTEVAPMRPGERWYAIDDVCAIVGYFLSDGTYDEAATLAWLRSRHERLGHERPLDAIGAGRFDEVRAAAERDLGMTVAEEEQPLPLPPAGERPKQASGRGRKSRGGSPASGRLSGEPAHSG